MQDAGFVAGLGADERRGLQAALERAGDDEVELDLQRVEDMRELKAVALAVFVERTLDVEQRIGAAGSGAGVAKDEEIHGSGFHCKSTESGRTSGYRRMNGGSLSGPRWWLRRRRLCGLVVEDSRIGFVEGRAGGFGVRDRIVRYVRGMVGARRAHGR